MHSGPMQSLSGDTSQDKREQKRPFLGPPSGNSRAREGMLSLLLEGMRYLSTSFLLSSRRRAGTKS